MNLNFQEKGSLKNPGVHFTGSGSYLIPQKELHLEELSLRMELDSVPCVVVENKGSFVITLPEQDISTWQVLANNASLSGNIRALDFLYFKFLLPEFVQSGICSADFLIKADSEARKIAGDLSFDLDHVNLSTGKAELINNSRLTGDMTFFSKGLQRIDELQIPTFNVQIKDHDEQIVKGTFQGGHDFRSMTTKFSGM